MSGFTDLEMRMYALIKAGKATMQELKSCYMAKAKRPVSIAGVEFDALINEERTLEADAPDCPVEDGFSVSDTIILHAQELSMTLYVTDTPVTWRNSGHGGAGWTGQVTQKLEPV